MTTTIPFALTDDERKAGPDEAMWQFVRVSDEYRKAFQVVSGIPNNLDMLEAIHAHLDDDAHIEYAQDASCRQRFGLAAWLDPAHKTLPRLKNEDDSWFFSLKRPVQEDRRLRIVDGLPLEFVVTPGGINFPMLLADETPFGYGRVRRIGPDRRYSSRPVCVAIDCSVPPDGQISVLEILANKHRKYWMDDGMKTTHDVDVVVEEVDSGSDFAFSRMHFKWARSVGATKYSTAHLWRVVCIDTLGAIGNQIADCRKKLRAVYQEIRDEKLFETAWPERFPHRVPPSPNGNRAPDGSSMLMALLKVATNADEINSSGKLPTVGDLVEKIDLYPKGIAHPAWAEHFQGEILTQHLPLARALKNGLYRWLGHTETTFSTR
ncbi:hypothetical protein [Paraburkholderia sp. BCC1885]|uniref:hypothetical protein n=1 Tax=Paraburkholderia sp. BCC1885 TaxID=2562669 RepID=UPI00118396BD|nr:hypothetical protein [Paraburkholderia sp. BCC1885]